MSEKPVGLAIPPSEYDKELVVASINSLISNLEMIAILFLNQLANKKLAPHRLIKKRKNAIKTN